MRKSLPFTLIWGAPVVAILITLLGGCTGATSMQKEKDTTEQPPETTKMEPSAYLRGTWRQSEPFEADGMQGMRYRTLTFTKSRFIDTNAEILADGTVHNQWQHPGTWEANADTITKTWRRWIDDEVRDENTTIEHRRYAWVDDVRTILLLQEWDADANASPVFREYRKVAPINPLGVWRWSRQVRQPWGERVWEIDATGPIVTWSYRDESPCTHTISGPAQIDNDELFLLIDVETETETAGCSRGAVDVGASVGHTARWAFAPGHNADTIAVSELWQELRVQDDGTWVNREDRPYGEYWQFFVRMVER